MKNANNFVLPVYYKILSREYPSFLKKYLSTPVLKRLNGIGLLCGTDWTPLYNNAFFYSRLNHSVGVALILWHFTHDIRQTVAGLLHDVSTPAFSHVSDFRNGDALKQESTEEKNAQMIHSDKELGVLLKQDGLAACDVDDYHKFPIADNEIPQLSADRLEYMFPSGAALNDSFDMDSIKRLYSDISLCYNELNVLEPCFLSVECAEEYCRRFCNAGLVLQKNENKLALQMLAEILTLAIENKIICENDLFCKSEKELIEHFDFIAKNDCFSASKKKFAILYRTFRTMKKIEHVESPLEKHFCVSLNVKKRYINPLVVQGDFCTNTIQLYSSTEKNRLYSVPNNIIGKRITAISARAKMAVDNFLSFNDTLYGCVKLVDC